MANLVLNGRSIDTIDEIAENFVEEDILRAFKSGSLAAWLEEYGYDEELEHVKTIKPTASGARIVTSIADALKLDDDVIAENAARREEQQRKNEEIRKAQEQKQELANDNQENNKQHLQVHREGGNEKSTEEISTGVAWKFLFGDGGLILEGLNNPQIISEKFNSEELDGTDEEVSSGRLYIDPELCLGCGVCKDSCPAEAITEGSPSVINQDKCVECGACVSECPAEAIRNFDDIWNNIDANLWNRIVNIIVEQLGVGYEQVTPDASFVDELGVDSLDAVELIMAFEEEFGAAITEEDAEKFTSAGKVYEYLSMYGYGTI